MVYSERVAKIQVLGALALGAVFGGLLSGSIPFVRYSYARVGSDLQRVDRLTGRVDWTGNGGWWNMDERQAGVEAEIARFTSRAEEISQAARTGRIASVSRLGRELTVYPIGAVSYKVYAADEQDPRLTDLIRKLQGYGIQITG